MYENRRVTTQQFQNNGNFKQKNQAKQDWGHFPSPHGHQNSARHHYEEQVYNHDLKANNYEGQKDQAFAGYEQKPYQFDAYSYQKPDQAYQHQDPNCFNFEKSDKEMAKDEMEMFCSASENSNTVFAQGKVEYSANYAQKSKNHNFAQSDEQLIDQFSEPNQYNDQGNLNYQNSLPCIDSQKELQYSQHNILPAAAQTFNQSFHDQSYQQSNRSQKNNNTPRTQKDNFSGFQSFKNNQNTTDSTAIQMGKAKISRDCYSYAYYIDYLPTQKAIGRQEPNEYIWPDILYTQKKDGEILIEWNNSENQLNMLTFVDLHEVYPEKQQVAIELAMKMQKLYHPNLLNLTAPVMILDNVQTLVFRSESPDHISSWKQFCKTNFSLGEKLSIFRQLASALDYLHQEGMVHRDMHPTRIHLNNGIVKFNTIGLPYNFKKLLRSECFTGHVNFSAPEIIKDSANFSSKIDVWSLGCCLFYLQTKLDPFEGKNITETKRRIQNLQLVGNPPLSSPQDQSDTSLGWHPIIHQLIYKCLIQDPKQRPSTAEIINLQDQLEYQTFGEHISKNAFKTHWDDFKAKSACKPPQDQLSTRVTFDQECVDYKGMNLNNRNCPWFFSKAYGHIQQNANQEHEESFNSIFKEQNKGQNQASHVVPKVMTKPFEAANKAQQQSANLNTLRLSTNKVHSQQAPSNQPVFQPEISPIPFANSCFAQSSPQKLQQHEDALTEQNAKLFGSYSDFHGVKKFTSKDKREYGNETEQPQPFHPQNQNNSHQVVNKVPLNSIQQDETSQITQQMKHLNFQHYDVLNDKNQEVPAFLESADVTQMTGHGQNKLGDTFKGNFMKQGFGEYVSNVLEDAQEDSGKKQPNVPAQKIFYEGEWASDLRHGQGKQKFYDQSQIEPHSPIVSQPQGQLKAEYDGTWVADLFDGIGTLKCYFPEATTKKTTASNNLAQSNISTYEGTFSDGKRHGQGVLKFACGSLYEGEFQDDHISGFGVFKFANSLASYQGNFEKGKFNGQGSLSFTRGNIVYQGEFVKGFLSGQGKLVNMLNNTFYDGLWFKGKMHGEGILYNYELSTPHATTKLPQVEQERIRKESIYKNFQIQGPEIEQVNNQFTCQEMISEVKILFRFQGVFKFGQRNGFGKQTTFSYVNDGTNSFTQVLVEGYWAQDTLQQVTHCSDSQNPGF